MMRSGRMRGALRTSARWLMRVYALGAAGAGEKLQYPFAGFQNGTISMRCMQWG